MDELFNGNHSDWLFACLHSGIHGNAFVLRRSDATNNNTRDKIEYCDPEFSRVMESAYRSQERDLAEA